MGKKKLTPKEALFVKEYLVDKNATRAAIAAGYSEKTAYSIGHELLSKPAVAAAIARGLEAQQKDAEARAKKRGITKERWLRELALIGFADMDDFVRVRRNGLEMVGSAERKKGRSRVIRKLTETATRDGGSVGLELHPKIPALLAIGKHLGWIVDKHELAGKDGGPIRATLTDEQRRGRLDELLGALETLKKEGGSDDDESAED